MSRVMVAGATVLKDTASSLAVGADVSMVVLAGAPVIGATESRFATGEGALVMMMVGMVTSTLSVEGAGVRSRAVGAGVKGAKVPEVASKVALSVVQEMTLYVRARTVRGALTFCDPIRVINTIK